MKPSFTHWRKNQPDNANGKEHCVHFYDTEDFFWNDHECSKKFFALCQQQRAIVSVTKEKVASYEAYKYVLWMVTPH